MDFQAILFTLAHDWGREIIGSLMIWVAGRLGKKVEKVLKDISCLFDRIRSLEKHLRLSWDAEKHIHTPICENEAGTPASK